MVNGIFDSSFEVAFPLTQDFLDYTYCDNDTNDIKNVGILHAIRAFPPEVVQRILNIK